MEEMTNSLSSSLSDFGLLLYLEDLNIKELMEFKLHLKDNIMGSGDFQIPWTEVKTSTRDLAKLMNEYYSVEQVWNVTINIFNKMNLMCLCERAKSEINWAVQTMQQDFRTELVQDTQSSVLEHSLSLTDGILEIKPGNSELQTTYDSLEIKPGTSEFQTTCGGLEIKPGTSELQTTSGSLEIKPGTSELQTTSGSLEIKPGTSANLGDGTEYKIRIIEEFGILYDNKVLPEESDFYDAVFQDNLHLLEDMFDMDVKTDKQPQRVILHGPSGIGKTTLMIQTMISWAEGNLFQQKFTYVFYINAREINQLKESSFLEIISKYWPSTEGPIERIMSQPRHLLFIIDNVDEMKCSFEEPQNALCKDWSQVHPVSFIMSSLLRNTMLPESSLLVTARVINNKLKFLKDLRPIELHSIPEDTIKKYIYKNFKDKKWALQTFSSLRDNEMLFRMCEVPKVCWTICNTLKQQMEKGVNNTLTCEIATAAFTRYVSSLFQPIDEKDPYLPSEIQLRRLCHLAAKGVWSMTYVFYGDDFRKHGLFKPDVSIFVNRHILQQDTEYESCYVFTSLHLQEYFAAMSYVLESDLESRSDSFQSFEHLRLLLESKMYKEPHLTMMKYFLFGLLNKDQIKQLQQSLNCTMLLDIKLKILSWLKRLGASKYFASQPEFLELMHLMYETQDEGFLKQAMETFEKVDITVLGETQLIVSSFCLKNCQYLQYIKLCTALVSKMLNSSLEPESWQRHANRISQCWKDLCSVLHTNENLKTLELQDCYLDELALKTLNQELRHPDCKLRRLLFRFLSFPDGCQDMFSSLTYSQNLRLLYLKETDIGDKGVESLCEALKDPECKLQDLSLESCKLTKDYCPNISKALIKNQNLINLNLSTNDLSDDGVKLLSEALKHPKCNLKRLSLANCHLTRACCLELASAISNSPNLYRLDLGRNDFRDDGVKVLNEALRNPSCNVQRLGLEDCGLTSLCCQDLAFTLSSSPKLVELNLAKNALGFEGIKKLSVILKSPECKLQILGLHNNAFDEEAQKVLENVQVSNPCLMIKSDCNEDRSWCWFL